MKLKRILAGVVALAVAAGAAQTAGAAASVAELKKLSVEELMNVQVYTASRRLEPTQSVPSAIFVLTQDDIRRSRVTSIPQALRLVPGVQVGRVDGNKWAVSIRGFNSREANKLLVMVDGRSIYDQLFSGTLWESQDVMIEDIERIEVIRGPGGALWGANAVNGVINIITKTAKDTQGALLTGIVGDEERYTGSLRYGWQTGENQHARAYLKSYQRDEGFADIGAAHDASRAARGGFRWDWGKSDGDRVGVSGDIFQATAGVRISGLSWQDIEHRGSNLITRWTHPFSDTNNVLLRFSFDRVAYDSETFGQTRRVYDFFVQQTLQAGARHQWVWGAGYQRARDDTSVSSIFDGLLSIEPDRRDDALGNLFVQDTIALVSERLALTLGSKYESTDYARSEWQPNVRLAWTPSAERMLWLSAARAARVPSRLESDLTFFGIIRPGDTLESEHVNAYEIGTRHLLTENFWFDFAAFYNRYEDLATNEAGGRLGNTTAGHTYGFELATRWTPLASWRIDLAYSYLKMNLALTASSTGDPASPRRQEGLAPRHQATLRSALDLPHDFELDTTLRFVDQLPTLDYPSYTALDLGLAWHSRNGIELALAGQNLLDSHHSEQSFVFSSTGIPSEVERSIFGKLTWAF